MIVMTNRGESAMTMTLEEIRGVLTDNLGKRGDP